MPDLLTAAIFLLALLLTEPITCWLERLAKRLAALRKRK